MGAEPVQFHSLPSDKLKELFMYLSICFGGLLFIALFWILLIRILNKCKRLRERNQVGQLPTVSHQPTGDLEVNSQQENVGTVTEMSLSPHRRLLRESTIGTQLGQQIQEIRIQSNSNDMLISIPSSQLLDKQRTRELTSSDIERFLPLLYFTEIERKYETHSCSICLEDFHSTSLCRQIISCHHIFHDTCIIEWLNNSQRIQTCPNCKEVLTKDNLQRAFEKKQRQTEGLQLKRNASETSNQRQALDNIELVRIRPVERASTVR